MIFRRIILFVLLLLLVMPAFATHNRAGEISFRHLGGLRYEVTVTTYTEVGGTQADRPFLPIDWGDNSGADSIKRSANPPRITSTIQQNIYKRTHEYPGPGRYIISVEDPNRNASIQNIPNSVAVPFYIESELIIDAFAGHNNSVRLLTPPIDFACVGNKFVHNPSAYDPDGDSVVFSLVASKGFNGVTIPGYSFPAALNSLTIDSRTGQLVWDSPQSIGEFNIAIFIEEYKNGIRVGSVLRDMQITVGKPCEHDPPSIENIASTCIEAGDTLSFVVFSNDTIDGISRKDGDSIELSATGGAFLIDNRAYFSQITIGSKVRGEFFWATSCENVRYRPYQIVFKAVDNGDPHLSEFQTIDIKIVAPAPKNPEAVPVKNNVELNWEESICKNAIGYKIYRRLGSNQFIPDLCQTGVPSSSGYKLIHVDSVLSNTSFTDNDNGKGLILGLEYCYRIVAFFADNAESYASEEVCVQLKKELPVITNVSVTSTSFENGNNFLAWSKPTEHDISIYPGPYRYVIKRKIWEDEYVVVDSTASINDTTYNDTLLNTQDNEYSYIIEMYDLSQGRTYMGPSVAASSIYLSSLAEDNQLVVQWSEKVPWINREYELSRQNKITGKFEVLDTVISSPYIDKGLANEVEYCYKLQSIGEYLVPGLIKPILNFSQIHCNAPKDTVPPCPPVLTLDVMACGGLNSGITDLYFNDLTSTPCEENGDENETLLRWTNPNNQCVGVDDVIEYRIYFKPGATGSFSQIYRSTVVEDTTYLHIKDNNSIAGCYYVTAVDSFGNESIFLDSVCVDNCPSYRLPNVFSPGNNDGVNDLFHPFPYCFIESVNIKIFNRWGQTVFETNDPEINWDGKNRETGKIASEGVYFYICEVNTTHLEGPRQEILNGFVHLFRNPQTKNSN